jgi:hypothetical protein
MESLSKHTAQSPVPVQPVEPDGTMTAADKLLSVATPYRDDGS